MSVTQQVSTPANGGPRARCELRSASRTREAGSQTTEYALVMVVTVTKLRG